MKLSTPAAATTEATEKSPAKADAATEYLLMGLRLYEGVSLNRLQHQFDVTLDPAKLQPLLEQGLLSATPGRLAATPSGMMLLNSILRQLLAD